MLISNIISLPLAFVRSGWISVNGGATSVVGQWSFNRSRVVQSTSSAYSLDIASDNVNPSRSNDRWDGFPLRCLYLGSV